MKNVIAYFSITTRTKAIVFYDESITIRLLSLWPLVQPYIFNTSDMPQQIQFLLHPKNKDILREIFITSSSK